ncbi:MAG: cytidylate kinase family protein [Alphaproteobacteria bacterium]|nr:cytidylate kinase family protein [Alphaproteobacteria bacterium]
MTVIAMTREMGTLGKDVAAGLSDALEIEVVHHEIVEHNLAQRLHLGENTVHRFLEGNASLWERWKINSERMSRYTAEEVLDLAKNQGNVLIRGWGAAQLLRDVPHVLCVRICAPMSKRVAVMMERLHVTDEKSIRLEIKQSDDAHSQTIQRQFSNDWRNPENYDIVLNTGFVSVENCVSVIENLVNAPAYQETKDSRRILADKIIESEVRKFLRDNPSDTPFGHGVRVAVAAGNVHLSGVVNIHSQIPEIIEEIRKLDGVTAVQNDVTFLPVVSGV